MFRRLSSELMTLVRLQFVVSVFIYLAFVIFLPRMGYAGLVMRIYPMVAAGYFVLFLMYAQIIFLYYFEDLNGALITAVCFSLVTFLASLAATHMSHIFYGFGVWMGSSVGFTVAFARLKWMEKHLNEHMFCRGNIMRRAKGIKPSPKVFDLYEQRRSEGSLEIDANKLTKKEKDDEETVIYH